MIRRSWVRTLSVFFNITTSSLNQLRRGEKQLDASGQKKLNKQRISGQESLANCILKRPSMVVGQSSIGEMQGRRKVAASPFLSDATAAMISAECSGATSDSCRAGSL